MKRFAPLLLVIIALCILALFFGPESLLIVRLPGGLPLGTLFAIVALTAGAAIPLTLSRPKTPLRWAGAVALAAAVLWFPVGVYLAGNVDLNFYNDAADSALFKQVTIGTSVLILATMLWTTVVSVLRRRARRRASSG